MWGDIYGWTKYILSLGTLTRRNRADIEEMREQIERLSDQVRELVWKEQQRGATKRFTGRTFCYSWRFNC